MPYITNRLSRKLHITFYEWWTQLWSGNDLSAAGSGVEAEAKTSGVGSAGDVSATSASARSTPTTPTKPTYTAPPAPPKPAPDYRKPTHSSGADRAAPDYRKPTYSSGADRVERNARTGNTSSRPARDWVGQTLVRPSSAMNAVKGQRTVTPKVVTQRVTDTRNARRTCSPNAPDYQRTEWWIEKVNQNHHEALPYIIQNPAISFIGLLLQYGMGLKEQESYLVIRHPLEALEVNEAKNLAGIGKTILYANDADKDIDGSRANAFLHAFWNAEITYRIGEDLAEKFTTAHETYTLWQYRHDDVLNEIDESTGFTIGENVAMDMHNNAIGRYLASKLPNSAEEIHNELLNQYGSEENIARLLSTYAGFSDVDLLLLRYTEMAINDGSLVWLYNK